jgi:hypothetical protein
MKSHHIYQSNQHIIPGFLMPPTEIRKLSSSVFPMNEKIVRESLQASSLSRNVIICALKPLKFE